MIMDLYPHIAQLLSLLTAYLDDHAEKLHWCLHVLMLTDPVR